MIIWLFASLLVALAAAIGYFMGGIRSAICLVGTVIAAFLASTVGAWMAGVVPMIGFKNPVWQFYIPPLLGFVVGSLVFLIIGLVVHHLVQRHYRNNADEYTYARWFRLNRRTGAAFGACLGTVWLVLLAIVVYVPGYVSTQLADAEEDSGTLRWVNSFSHGMEETGLLKIVEHFRPVSERHLLAADILGLVYNNPAIHSRLASYPPFLGLAEKPEIAELGRDPEINTLIQSRASLGEILEHQNIRAVVDNHELLNELLALDLKDLEAYLRSGISEKFRDEHILGRWRLNVRRSIAEMKLVSADVLPRVEFNLLRRALNVYLDQMTLGFTTDHRTLLKVKAKDEQKLMQVLGRSYSGGATPGAAPQDPNSPPPAVGTGPGLSARSIASRAIPSAGSAELADRYGLSGGMADRYGTGGGGAAGGSGAVALAATGAVPARVPARASATTLLAPLMSTGEGTWSRSGDVYQIQIAADGKTVSLEARVKDNLLTTMVEGRVLVFDRI